MTISSTPCSCDGLNENCFRCWGTGMVEPKTLPNTGPKGDCFPPRTRRVVYPAKRFDLPRVPAKTQTPLVQCPHCGVGVLPKRLEKHLLKAHRYGQSGGHRYRDGWHAVTGPVLPPTDAAPVLGGRSRRTDRARDSQVLRRERVSQPVPLCEILKLKFNRLARLY